MLWPQCDTMPVPLTPSDVAFLDKIRRVIEIAHQELGMRFLITVTANVSGNAQSAQSPFETRSFFEVCQDVDPRVAAQWATPEQYGAKGYFVHLSDTLAAGAAR